MNKIFLGKSAPEDKRFSHIHPGDRIFVGTGCGEPRYLVQAFIRYVESHPKAFPDVEVWTLGVAPYTDGKFKHNFRYNSFFVGTNMRDAMNMGMADYTPIFLSAVPDLFYRRVVSIDVALIQASPPDHHGYLNLGVSVDIVKAAVENSSLVIAQHHNMVAINSALQIDLTGQATVESIGKLFYSGIGTEIWLHKI